MKGTAPTWCQFSIQANSPLQQGTATWILTCFDAQLQLKWAPSSGQFKPQGALKVCYSLLPSSGFVCFCILKGKSTDFTYQAYESSGIVSSIPPKLGKKKKIRWRHVVIRFILAWRYIFYRKLMLQTMWSLKDVVIHQVWMVSCCGRYGSCRTHGY